MRPTDLLRWLVQQPFRPFRLLVTTGLAYEVRHPELVLVGRSTVTLEFPGSQFPIPAANRVIVLALIHIVQLELLETHPSPSAN
jgi:hypothetical protein